MEDKRKLTGKYSIRKRFLRKPVIMVEVKVLRWFDYYGTGGGGYAPYIIEIQKATDNDLIQLNINN